MITVSKETREKINKAADIVSDFSNLTEKFSEEMYGTAGNEPDFTTELLRERAKAISDGDFKTVVCGKFKNGKSTFVNALLEKKTMAAKATACTAVIAIVTKGEDEDSVNVIYNNGSSKKMSLNEFTKNFQLTVEEQEKIDAAAENGEDIVFDRFTDVDHVEMHSMHPMFESGCSLVDTPGLEEALSREKTTKEYLPKADAIIFMLDATNLFSKTEREFINEYFANKHKNNVFFVVNRFNQLQPGELEKNIIPTVKEGLYSSFTDEQGNFDEDLFSRRVFYINAQGAFCAVTGQPEQVFASGSWHQFPVEINTTGLPEYEKSLMEFINSDERNNAVFSSALDVIADSLKGTVKEMDAKINAMAMNDSERQAAAAAARESLKKAQEAIEDIEDAFARFGALASNAMFLDLMSYFDKSIKGEFPAHVKNEITAEHYNASNQIVDGLLNAVAALPIKALRKKAEEISKKHMKPISDDLDAYIKNKMLLWQTQSNACIKPYIDDLNKEINSFCDEFDANIAASFKAFEENLGPRKRTAKGNLQIAIATVLGKDMSALVDINNGEDGSISWGNLAGKFLGQSLIDVILLNAGPQFVLLKFGIDALIVALKAKDSAQKRALSMGMSAIDNYKGELMKKELSFKKSIISNINEKKEKISETARKNLECESNKVKSLGMAHKKSKQEEDAMRKRLEAIIEKMGIKVEDLYEIINGRRPTEAEFKKLGKNSN